MNDKVPYVKTINGVRDLINDGYLFIRNRADEYRTNIFETSILGKNLVFISGEEATKQFYDSELFQRNNATPKRVQKTLFGIDAIQTMDGEEHLHRKKLFMSLMTKSYENQLIKLVNDEWFNTFSKLKGSEKVVLFHKSREVICKATCKWAGVPLTEVEVMERADDFTSMVDAFGAVGPRHWKGRIARTKTEKWIAEIIEDVRSKKIIVDTESPLYTMSFHRDFNDNLLDTQMASIELINLIRPIIAISIYITFAATALHEHPEWKVKFREKNSECIEMFVQEVRRHYPIAPFLGALVKKDFAWNNYEFKKHMLVLLDVYGTNHDPELWDNPYEFNPNRFKNWNGSEFALIPQGGGYVNKGHRCPGESITIEVIKNSLDFLVNNIDYELPDQDLSYSLTKMPTLPESGFIMTNIKYHPN